MVREHRKKVVVIGGGFGGLYVAKELAASEAEVTIVDRRNFHLFQPLLYQLASGFLAPGDIAAPLREIFSAEPRIRPLMLDVTAIDPITRTVSGESAVIPYDLLVIATGSTHHFFGHDDWSEYAVPLKSTEDAIRLRSMVLGALESAEGESDSSVRAAQLTFIIVGGGPTGVELAGTLAELTRRTLRGQYRAIDPTSVRIILVQSENRLLPTFAEKLSKWTERRLTKLGVEIRTGTTVVALNGSEVEMQEAGGNRQTISTRTVMWAAGVKASPLGTVVARAIGAETDRSGRVTVLPDFSLPGHPEIFIIGDAAHAEFNGKPLPQLAPVAIQEGRFVGRLIAAKLDRERTAGLPIFRYRDRGQLAVIGRGSAVAELWGFRLTGIVAWLLWALVHLWYLVGFDNKIVVLLRWAWNYIAYSRANLLITMDPASSTRHACATEGRKVNQ